MSIKGRERPVAVAVGLLYAAATAAGAAAAVLAAPTEVRTIAGHRGEVVATAGLVAVMAISVAGLAALLYPLLVADARTTVRRGMATWFLGCRLTQGTLFLVAATAVLALLAVGEAPRSTADASLGVGLGAVYHYAAVAGQTVFSIGAALMSWLLLVSGRVPAWLAVWGLAAPLLLAAGLLLPFTHDPSSPIASALYAPMAVQEIVLAGWLAARGFRPLTPAPSGQARPAVSAGR